MFISQRHQVTGSFLIGVLASLLAVHDPARADLYPADIGYTETLRAS